MNYTEVIIEVEAAYSDILIAELYEKGYDSFAETAEGLTAYIDAEKFDEHILKDLCLQYRDSFAFDYSFKALENKNWNEEWEKNFQPVTVQDRCIVRASFHVPEKAFEYDIIINPKMSFGTGHHETTFMMIDHMLGLDLKGKTVIDAGSGTGILSIMASRLGAVLVSAFDIEPWAYENSLENIQQNHCTGIYVSMGSIGSVDLPLASFDVVLANINKNVLLDEISVYSQFLNEKGQLILSGFYEEDISDIDEVAKKCFLKMALRKSKNKWASIVYEKSKNS
jgi:ribosomal protein L11 methyltransferase